MYFHRSFFLPLTIMICARPFCSSGDSSLISFSFASTQYALRPPRRRLLQPNFGLYTRIYVLNSILSKGRVAPLFQAFVASAECEQHCFC